MSDETKVHPDKSRTTLRRAVCRGNLRICEELEGECYVLEGDLRVFSKRDAFTLLTGERDGHFERLADRAISRGSNGAKDDENDPEGSGNSADSNGAKGLVEIVEFTTDKNLIAHGVSSADLVRVARALQAAFLTGRLHHKQIQAAYRSMRLLAACAEIGLDALVDEATGYQRVRDEWSHRRKLDAAIRSMPMAWERMFPERLWLAFAALERRTYEPGSRPMHWGKIVAEIYRAFDVEVANRLSELEPTPEHGRNWHQWLTPEARSKFASHLEIVIALAATAQSMADFKAKVGTIFFKNPLQLSLYAA